MAKETYIYGKRDLYIWQKRPMYDLGSKGGESTTFLSIRLKRDLYIWQKRPMYMAKETYVYGKRDLIRLFVY
jgi:hypothetical protein